MSIYELDRVQESRSWVEKIGGLPTAAMAGELVSRAHAVVEELEEGPYRSMIEQRISFVFDPEAGKEYRTEREAAAVVAGAEELLEEEADIAGTFQEFLWEEARRDRVGEEEDDYFAEERKAEYLAERARERSLRKMAHINEVVSAAEFGVNFGEAPSGRQWYATDTMEAVREVMMLQGELNMPIASDRLRELIVHGLDELYDTVAAGFLVKIADQAEDYDAFVVASERYKRAIDGCKNIEGLQGRMVRTATKFISSGISNPDVIDTALTALAHSDPTSLTYPFDCARLGLALQKVA